MNKLFKRITSAFTLFFFTLMMLTESINAMAGTTIVIAQPSVVIPTWATHAAVTNNWITMPNAKGFGNMVNYWPKDNFTQIGSMAWSPDPENTAKQALRVRMLDSEKWMRYGREDSGQNGVASSMISERINQFPKTASYVFANYSPDSAELIIEVQKIEKSPAGVLNVYRSDFTPWHGEFNKWKRDYLTWSEQQNPAQMGYNPFEKFKGATKTDNVFHNISWEAAGVAIGEAMKRYDAHVGYIASDKTRFTQSTKKSGGLFKKTVTTYIDGWAKPQWFVSMPLGHQPMGGTSAICVKSTGAATANGNTTACDAPEHVAISGISIQSWEGGNMPSTEENVYSYVNKKSSFTMLAFTILTFAVTWGLASALSGAIGGLAGGIAPMTAGAIGAGVYAGVNMLQGTALTAAQSGWAGTTGDGVLTPNFGSMDEHQQRLIQGVQNKQIKSRVGTGLGGAKQLYSGNCPESYTVTQCKSNGLDPGTMHRADSYSESNVTLQLEGAKASCVAQFRVANPSMTNAQYDTAYQDELTGVRKWVQQCIAPQGGVWATGH